MLEYRVWSIEYRGSACLEVGSALRADLVAPFSVPDLHDCLKVGRSLPWPPFAKARATTGQSLRSYQSPSAHGREGDYVPTQDSHSKGDRKPEGWLGVLVSGLRSRPSGIWFGCSGSGTGSGNPPSVICHRCSTLTVSGGRWRPRVAGGRPDPFSPLFSPQRSPPFSPPSSIQSSVIDSALH